MVALEQDFGIAAGMEGVAQLFQFAAQFGEVVDRAIEGQGQAQVRVDHRLRRGVRQVHDFQSTMAEGYRPLAMETPGIGAARGHMVGDPLKRGEVRGASIET